MNQWYWTTILFVYHQEIFNNFFAIIFASINYACRLIINNILHSPHVIITGVEASSLTSLSILFILSSFSILGIVYHFSFSTSLPITVDIPTAHRRNPCGQEGKGHGLPRDPCDRNHTQRYTVTRDASNYFLSFTVPPFYLEQLDSRYLLLAESPLFCSFLRVPWKTNDEHV